MTGYSNIPSEKKAMLKENQLIVQNIIDLSAIKLFGKVQIKDGTIKEKQQDKLQDKLQTAPAVCSYLDKLFSEQQTNADGYIYSY